VFSVIWFTTGRRSPLPAAVGAIGASLCVACLALASSRESRRSLTSTVMGSAGGLLCAGLVWASGSVRTYVLPGLLLEGVYAVVLALSLLSDRPLPLIFADLLLGTDTDGTRGPERVRAYRCITRLWSMFFLVEFLVKGWLYLTRSIGPLLIAKAVLDGASVLCLAVTLRALGRVT
jgi:uncharacterized membrane protein